jgi:hypothetical protein
LTLSFYIACKLTLRLCRCLYRAYRLLGDLAGSVCVKQREIRVLVPLLPKIYPLTELHEHLNGRLDGRG